MYALIELRVGPDLRKTPLMSPGTSATWPDSLSLAGPSH